MSTNIRVNMDSTPIILARRKLQKNGEAQIFFTKECAKEMNNFAPYKTGRLKDMTVEIGTDFVKYNAKYSAKQYYTNKGTGIQGESNGGLRGKLWDKRMFIIKGKELLNKIADFVGGVAGWR